MTRGYMQIETDEWIEPQHGEFVDQCCDCGLTHVMKFAVINRKTRKEIPGAQVQFRLKIDRRRTAASRRKLKFSKEKD
jgi:Zn-finger protein